MALREDLEKLLNGYENVSNTPDFILAAHLMNSLESFNAGIKARERWYGYEHRPGEGNMSDLDHLKNMLLEADIEFTVEHDTEEEEIDLEFRTHDMIEEILFVFNMEGKLKEVL